MRTIVPPTFHPPPRQTARFPRTPRDADRRPGGGEGPPRAPRRGARPHSRPPAPGTGRYPHASPPERHLRDQGALACPRPARRRDRDDGRPGAADAAAERVERGLLRHHRAQVDARPDDPGRDLRRHRAWPDGGAGRRHQLAGAACRSNSACTSPAPSAMPGSRMDGIPACAPCPASTTTRTAGSPRTDASSARWASIFSPRCSARSCS